jgi:hypothetical protein
MVPTYYDTLHDRLSKVDPRRLGVLAPSMSGRDRGRGGGYESIIWGKDKGPTLAEVRRAAHEGCHFCTMILTTWLVRRSNLDRGIKDSGSRATLGDHSYEGHKIFLALKNGYLFGCSLKPQRRHEPKLGFGLADVFQQYGGS